VSSSLRSCLKFDFGLILLRFRGADFSLPPRRTVLLSCDAEASQVTIFCAYELAYLSRAGFAVTVVRAFRAGGQAMLLVAYISFVALLSLAFVPDLSRD
jgi:hypothetical protein